MEPNDDHWEPLHPRWTPCEDRTDPAAWDDVHDNPYPGRYHDPDAGHDAD